MLAAALALVAATPAEARPERRLFEPTDLELEDPGTSELDMQTGLVRGSGGWRLTIPDVELDIGLSRQVELDVDGAFAFEAPPDQGLHFDHIAPDNVWLALKTGLADFSNGPDHGSDPGSAFAIGLQLGPKLPLAAGAHGLGIEGLVLLGFHQGGTHLVLNAGGLWDPKVAPNPGDPPAHPHGFEGGFDIDQDLDKAGHWSATGEIGAVHFLSSDPDQLTATFGIAWDPSEIFELSLVGLVGFLPGSDRYGVLIGISPKLVLGKHE